MTRQRSIVLDPVAPLPSNLQAGTLLVGIYRDEMSDLLYVRMRTGRFAFSLDQPDAPETREQAVTEAREFLAAIGYDGPLMWQLGGCGAVTHKPNL